MTPHQRAFLTHVRDHQNSPYEVRPATVYSACMDKGWVTLRTRVPNPTGQLKHALWDITEAGIAALDAGD